MAASNIDAVTRDAEQGDTEAQFKLAMHYRARRQNVLADKWLSRAATAGHVQAQLLRAAGILGSGPQARLDEACRYLENAAAAGNPDARFLYANQVFLGEGVARDPQRARDYLESAASENLPAAWRVLAMLHAINDSHSAVAARCFLHAAQLGDPFAQYVVGVTAQTADARKMIESAAARGVYLAKQVLARSAAEFAQGQAPTGNDADAPVSLEAAMDFDWPEPAVSGMVDVAEQPRIAEAGNALTRLECDYLICFAQPVLTESRAIDPESGKSVRDPVRTSSGMNFTQTFKDMVIGHIEHKMASAADVEVRHGEPLAILNYRVGEQYKPHFDAFLPGDPGAGRLLEQGGQRVKTVLVYLNDDFTGGGTEFPERSLCIAPERGKLLLMENCDAQGRPSKLGLHCGLPVEQGEKWLASMWVREQPFRKNWDNS